jgi:hypothetical protein
MRVPVWLNVCNTRIIEQQDRKKSDVELVYLSFGQLGQT